MIKEHQNTIDPVLVHEYLTRTARLFPDRTALIYNNIRINYRELDEKTTKLAASFSKLGIKRQDRIIIFLENSSDIVISLYGILKAGAIFIVLNDSIKSDKLHYIINDSSASLIITNAKKIDTVNEALKQISNIPKIVVIPIENASNGESNKNIYYWDELINNFGEQIDDYNKPITEGIIDCDLATLLYTSGTTGEPKGVMTSHFNMLAVSKSIINYLENDQNDIILNVLPLSFGYGLYQVIPSIMYGGTVILESSFMFPIKILQLIEKEKATGFPMVPTIFALLFNLKNLDKYDLSSLRYITNAGAALSAERILKLKTILPKTKIFSMYGLTECQRVSYLNPAEIEIRPSSVGKAIPNCEVFLLNENNEEVGVGDVGELVVRGSNVMRGYWNAPELTKKTFREGKIPGEKLLYSGDLFKKDEDGYLYFVSRKDDIIKTKGEKVSPKEVEHTINSLEGIIDTAVIPVHDQILGSAIKAFVVKKKESNINDKDILKFCSEKLEPFMVPKYIEFIDQLPKSINGKIDKKVLIAMKS